MQDDKVILDKSHVLWPVHTSPFQATSLRLPSQLPDMSMQVYSYYALTSIVNTQHSTMRVPKLSGIEAYPKLR
jgi:hypothetical protein